MRCQKTRNTVGNRLPGAHGKWYYDEWESRSGKPGYSIILYAEGAEDVYVQIWCRANKEKAVTFDWGKRRPTVADDAFKVKQSDGSLHSTSHPVQVRYGDGTVQFENWQIFSQEMTHRNRSLPSAYVGDDAGYINRYQRVDTLTVWTDTDSETIKAEFDVRRLDKALARLNHHCD